MEIRKLRDTSGGWFIGDFDRAIYRTAAAEAAVKIDKAGTRTAPHVHRVSVEITVVVKGAIRINGKDFSAGNIIIVSPGEAAEYESIEDSITIVIKLPSLPGDKYPAALNR